MVAKKLTVVVPTCRSIDHILQVIRDFRNQTYKNFEMIIVHDGTIDTMWEYAVQSERSENMYYTEIPKSNDKWPGTTARHKGTELAKTEFIVFCDDDDRYKDIYLENLMFSTSGNHVTVVQMQVTKNKVFKNGNPKETTLIPAYGMDIFPVVCHVGTPCCAVRTEWANAWPWRDIKDHDYHFFAEIIKNLHFKVSKIPGAVVDVDGAVIGKLKNWVSKPPFIR